MGHLYERETLKRHEEIRDPGLHSVGLASDAVLRARETGDPIIQREAVIRLARLVANEPGALGHLARIQDITLEPSKPETEKR
jgi:hypothetical protein